MEEQAIAEAKYYFVVQNASGKYFQRPIDRVEWGDLSTAREFDEKAIALLIRNLFGGTVVYLSK